MADGFLIPDHLGQPSKYERCSPSTCISHTPRVMAQADPSAFLSKCWTNDSHYDHPTLSMTRTVIGKGQRKLERQAFSQQREAPKQRPGSTKPSLLLEIRRREVGFLELGTELSAKINSRCIWWQVFEEHGRWESCVCGDKRGAERDLNPIQHASGDPVVTEPFAFPVCTSCRCPSCE